MKKNKVIAISIISILFIFSFIMILQLSLKSSQPCKVAEKFIKQDRKIRKEIGDIKDISFFVSGSIINENAKFKFNVEGSIKATKFTVKLSKVKEKWVVNSVGYGK